MFVAVCAAVDLHVGAVVTVGLVVVFVVVAECKEEGRPGHCSVAVVVVAAFFVAPVCSGHVVASVSALVVVVVVDIRRLVLFVVVAVDVAMFVVGKIAQ